MWARWFCWVVVAAAIGTQACRRDGGAGAGASGERGAEAEAGPEAGAAARAESGAAREDAAFVSAAAAVAVADASVEGPARGGAPVEGRQAFTRSALEPAQLAAIFAQVPELARIGRDVRFFTEGDVKAIVARTGAAHDGITFLTTPIVWSPETGVELLVATGRGRAMSFVVALWPLPGDRYRFASSFLMLNDLSPVALAFESTKRKELRWTSCWGCPGEQGIVSYRSEEHRVVIVQQ